MEKERNSKLIVIIALVVAVAGLSFGFAAFTKELDISFSESGARLTGDLDVRLHKYNNTTDEFEFDSKVISPYSLSGEGTEAGNLIISDDYSSISGGSLNLNGASSGVIYLVGIFNYSEYDAYLSSVDFLNYDGTNSFKSCIAVNGTDQSLVDEACNDIFVNIVITDDLHFKDSTVDNADFSNFVIPKGEGVYIYVMLGYDNDAVIPNGDFKVNFGNIKFNFSSVAPETLGNIKQKNVSLEYGNVYTVDSYDNDTGILEFSLDSRLVDTISSVTLTYNGNSIPVTLNGLTGSFVANEVGVYEISMNVIKNDLAVTFREKFYVSYDE